MPNRILREGILSSERVNELGAVEEVFYRRLMSIVDDFGRYYAHPSLLRAALYPLQLEKVSDSDIVKWLLVTGKAGLVRVYPAEDGKRYLELLDFRQQVRAKDSRFPAFDAQLNSTCVADAAQTPINSKASAHLVVVEDVDVGESPRKRGRPPQKTPLPDGFAVSERVKSWASGKGYERLDEHLESFVRKCKAKDYRYVDWDEAFMNAIADDWGKLNFRQPATASVPVWDR